MSKRDYYQVLGLDRSATPQQIKRAYRQLAKKFHPDHYRGKDTAQASEKFNEVQEAYSILSDPQKRKLYDQFGHSGLEGGGPSVAQRVWRTGPTDFNFRDFADTPGGFESIFEQVFSRGRRARRPSAAPAARGQDLVHKITLPFLKAALGTKRTIKLHMSDVTGAGRFEVIEAKIPPGVSDGARIRIRGKGRSAPRGGTPGDLYLEVTVEPHPYLRREGSDIYVELPLSFAEAALGGEIEVPTLEGTTSLKVPPGVSSGQKLRLREKGIPPASGSGQRGHQYAVVKIVSPPKLNDQAKRLIREFQQATAHQPSRFK